VVLALILRGAVCARFSLSSRIWNKYFGVIGIRAIIVGWLVLGASKIKTAHVMQWNRGEKATKLVYKQRFEDDGGQLMKDDG
jgi:hypothetical protein